MSGEEGFKSTEELDQFIESAEQWLHTALSKCGLNRQKLQQSEELVTCPVDSHHRMPQPALEKHLKYCTLRKRGYTDQQIDEQSGSEVFYEKATTVATVKLDLSTLHSVCRPVSSSAADIPSELPLTVDRFNSDLKPPQRLAIYEHVMQEATSAQKQTTIPADQMSMLTEDWVKSFKKEEKKPKSELELLAMQRDMKRRRQSYKGKSYTAKKTHKQIISDVINNHTDLLRNVWTKEQEPDVARPREGSHDSRNTGISDRHGRRLRSRSKSNSRDQKKKKAKKHRSRSKSRERDHHKKKKHKKKSKD